MYSCMPLAWKMWWNWSVMKVVLSVRPKSKSDPPPSASTRQRPPVMPADQPSARNSLRRGTSPRHSGMSASAPSSGTAHCTITRIIVTVRNLSYPGRYLNASWVSPMKLWPQASSSAATLAATSHHLLRPLARAMPSAASISAAAPR